MTAHVAHPHFQSWRPAGLFCVTEKRRLHRPLYISLPPPPTPHPPEVPRDSHRMFCGSPQYPLPEAISSNSVSQQSGSLNSGSLTLARLLFKPWHARPQSPFLLSGSSHFVLPLCSSPSQLAVAIALFGKAFPLPPPSRGRDVCWKLFFLSLKKKTVKVFKKKKKNRTLCLLFYSCSVVSHPFFLFVPLLPPGKENPSTKIMSGSPTPTFSFQVGWGGVSLCVLPLKWNFLISLVFSFLRHKCRTGKFRELT